MTWIMEMHICGESAIPLIAVEMTQQLVVVLMTVTREGAKGPTDKPGQRFRSSLNASRARQAVHVH